MGLFRLCALDNYVITPVGNKLPGSFSLVMPATADCPRTQTHEDAPPTRPNTHTHTHTRAHTHTYRVRERVVMTFL